MDGIGEPRLSKSQSGGGVFSLGGTGDCTGCISSSREVLQVTGVHRIPFCATFTALLQSEQTQWRISHVEIGFKPISRSIGSIEQSDICHISTYLHICELKKQESLYRNKDPRIRNKPLIACFPVGCCWMIITGSSDHSGKLWCLKWCSGSCLQSLVKIHYNKVS